MADVASAASAVSAVSVSDAFQKNANDALVTIISRVTQGLDSAVSFLSAQLPDVIHQLLMWHFTTSLVKDCFGFLIIIMFIVCDFYLFRVMKEEPANSKDEIAGFCAFLVILSLVGTAIVYWLFLSFDWLEIWVAPKIWLIEYGTTLLKGN